MENNNQNIQHKHHKIIYENMKNICLTGVEKADNATPTHFSCICMGRELHIIGKDMSVKKLDVAEGVAELEGEITEIKYAGEKKSLLKRLFK